MIDCDWECVNIVCGLFYLSLSYFYTFVISNLLSHHSLLALLLPLDLNLMTFVNTDVHFFL